jgi:hypothetical protein
MPLMDSNLQSTWDALYKHHIADGQIIGFDRSLYMAEGSGYRAEAELLRLALGIVAGQKVALIGGAFGWIGELWNAQGVDCYITDTSTWVHANKGVQAVLPILNETALTLQSRRNILQAAGLPNNGRFAWAVTEDVLPMLTNNEATQLSSGLRNFADNVGHWITVGTEADAAPGVTLNWKTLAAWKTLVNPDKVVARGGSVAL